MIMKKRLVAAVVALAMGGAVQAATLGVGDAAPKLQVGKWVQGEAVKEFEKDKAYVVEFWATWCGPCRVTIPHLNKLHNAFKEKGLVIIGQSVWEQDDAAVAPFVKKIGDKMTYRVALDGKGFMSKNWMDAAGQTGIPTAFVVDTNGVIAWIGHPSGLTERLLTQVLEGTFDVARAKADYQRERAEDAKETALWNQLREQTDKQAWADAERTIAEIEKLLPEDRRDDLGQRKFSVLLERKDEARAYALARRLSDDHPQDASLQNGLAWTIATKPRIANRDLDLAEKIARRANETSKGSDAEVLDTLARVLFLKGQKEAAIELQAKAVQFAEGARKEQFERNLRDYRQGKVPNEALVAKLRADLRRGIKMKAWDQADAALAELGKVLPEEEHDGLALDRFRVLLGRKSYKAAYATAAKWSDAHPNDRRMQNELAWQIATDPELEVRDLDLAEKIARRACEAAEGKDAESLDTLARVLFLKGQREAALDFQKKAVAHATGQRQVQFEETLKSYEEGKAPKAY